MGELLLLGVFDPPKASNFETQTETNLQSNEFQRISRF